MNGLKEKRQIIIFSAMLIKFNKYLLNLNTL